MKWYLIVIMATSVTIEPMTGKSECEELRALLQSSFGRGASLVDVRCVPVNDSGGKR